MKTWPVIIRWSVAVVMKAQGTGEEHLVEDSQVGLSARDASCSTCIITYHLQQTFHLPTRLTSQWRITFSCPLLLIWMSSPAPQPPPQLLFREPLVHSLLPPLYTWKAKSTMECFAASSKAMYQAKQYYIQYL